MAIHESGENYLEQILILEKSIERVRAIDLSAALGFARPTVSIMLRDLLRDGFIERDADDSLTLTPRGREVAERIYERHCVLAAVLMEMGVSPDTAAKDACLIEHDISDESFARIKAHVQANRS